MIHFAYFFDQILFKNTSFSGIEHFKTEMVERVNNFGNNFCWCQQGSKLLKANRKLKPSSDKRKFDRSLFDIYNSCKYGLVFPIISFVNNSSKLWSTHKWCWKYPFRRHLGGRWYIPNINQIINRARWSKRWWRRWVRNWTVQTF